MAHWYGTVAAVRDLGRRGIDVWVSSNSPVRQAVWSRYAARRLRAPDEHDARPWLRWLLEIGRKNPGTALCATSDDLRFLFAAEEAELRKWFQFATLPLSTLRELLDKGRLQHQADRVGLRTPLTFFPQDAGEAGDMIRNQPGRFLIKQRTQVFSRTRHLGVGLLFEGVTPDPDIEEKVLRLCRNVGYTGVFQAEFLEVDGDRLLIDFNPRFYNYMAFDEARGLPLAYLDYLFATGASEARDAEMERARSGKPTSPAVYCNHVGTWVQLQTEWLFGRSQPGELARWRSWRSQAARTIDPVWDKDDLMPGVADILMQIRGLLRHPRASFRANSDYPPLSSNTLPTHPQAIGSRNSSRGNR